MRSSLYRTASFFVLFATAALTACSGPVGNLVTSTSAIPAAGPRATQVVVIVADGAKRLANIPTVLFVCVDQPFCLRKDRVLKRGTTGTNGQVTLTASFSSSDVICAEAQWVSGSSTREKTSCQNNFPNRITLNFSAR